MDKQTLINELNLVMSNYRDELKTLDYQELALRIEKYQQLTRMLIQEKLERDLQRVKVDPNWTLDSVLNQPETFSPRQPKQKKEEKPKLSQSVAAKQERFKDLLGGVSLDDMIKTIKAKK